LKGKRKIVYKSSWGGYRESAGRPRKYHPIKLDFQINEEDSIIRALTLVPSLLLEDKISTHRARALIYCLKTMWEIIVPFQQIKEAFEEVKRQHANILLQKTPDPVLGEVLKDLPIEVVDKIRAALRNRDQNVSELIDYF
jgi:hypothetical protein